MISVGCQSNSVARAPSVIASEEIASGKNSLQANLVANLTLNSFQIKPTVTYSHILYLKSAVFDKITTIFDRKNNNCDKIPMLILMRL